MRKSCIPYVPYRSLLLSAIALNDSNFLMVKFTKIVSCQAFRMARSLQKRTKTFSYFVVNSVI